MKKQIEVTILPDGTIKAKTHGIYGEKCKEYISVLQELLEARATEIAYTEDYYRQNLVVEEQNKNRHGK